MVTKSCPGAAGRGVVDGAGCGSNFGTTGVLPMCGLLSPDQERYEAARGQADRPGPGGSAAGTGRKSAFLPTLHSIMGIKPGFLFGDGTPSRRWPRSSVCAPAARCTCWVCTVPWLGPSHGLRLPSPPVWSRVAGNCHLDRPTVELLKQQGMEAEEFGAWACLCVWMHRNRRRM